MREVDGFPYDAGNEVDVDRSTQLGASHRDRPAQQPMPGDLLVVTEQLLAQAPGVRGHDAEGDVVDDPAQVGDVVVDALGLEQLGPDPLRGVAHGDTERLLDRLGAVSY